MWQISGRLVDRCLPLLINVPQAMLKELGGSDVFHSVRVFHVLKYMACLG